MKILLRMFEWNINVRMSVKIVDLLYSKTEDYNTMYFAKYNNKTFKVILVDLCTSRESGRTPMWWIVAFTFRSLHKNNSYSTLSRLPIVFLCEVLSDEHDWEWVWINTIPQKGSKIESQRPLVTGPDALVKTIFIRI